MPNPAKGPSEIRAPALAARRRASRRESPAPPGRLILFMGAFWGYFIFFGFNKNSILSYTQKTEEKSLSEKGLNWRPDLLHSKLGNLEHGATASSSLEGHCKTTESRSI